MWELKLLKMDLFRWFFIGVPLIIALIPTVLLYKKLKAKQSKWKWLIPIGIGIVVYIIISAIIAAVIISQVSISRGGNY